MRLLQPLSGKAGHLQTVERVLRDLFRESGHGEAELFRELPAHIDGMPVPGLSGQNTEAARYFGKDLGG